MHQFGGIVIVAESRRGRMGSSTDMAFLEEITTSCGLQKGRRGTGSARGNECVATPRAISSAAAYRWTTMQGTNPNA
jgi:hypothetical protein